MRVAFAAGCIYVGSRNAMCRSYYWTSPGGLPPAIQRWRHRLRASVLALRIRKHKVAHVTQVTCDASDGSHVRRMSRATQVTYDARDRTRNRSRRREERVRRHTDTSLNRQPRPDIQRVKASLERRVAASQPYAHAGPAVPCIWRVEQIGPTTDRF